jgi:hypothetical protein
MSDAPLAGGHLLFAQQTITTLAPSPASAREVAKRMPRAPGNQLDLVFRRNGPRHSQLAMPQRPTLFESSLTNNTTGRIVQPPA